MSTPHALVDIDIPRWAEPLIDAWYSAIPCAGGAPNIEIEPLDPDPEHVIRVSDHQAPYGQSELEDLLRLARVPHDAARYSGPSPDIEPATARIRLNEHGALTACQLQSGDALFVLEQIVRTHLRQGHEAGTAELERQIARTPGLSQLALVEDIESVSAAGPSPRTAFSIRYLCTRLAQSHEPPEEEEVETAWRNESLRRRLSPRGVTEADSPEGPSL